MATISKSELEWAFLRLGQLADAEGLHIELLLLGGGVMVLAFDARAATRDVDVMILEPEDRSRVTQLCQIIGAERGWPADWLNEGAKGFLVSPIRGAELIAVAGLTVRMPPVEQLLAMKLCAWRDDVDISDALRLLKELPGSCDWVWNQVEPHLQPGRELKAKYAFKDLWESLHGSA